MLTKFIEVLTGALTIFAFGTWLFWIGLLVLFFTILFFVENERGSKATFTLILLALYLQFAAGLPFFQLVRDHPFWTVGLYVLGGLIYGPTRWAWHNAKFRQRYKMAKAEFMKANNFSTEQFETVFEVTNHPSITDYNADLSQSESEYRNGDLSPEEYQRKSAELEREARKKFESDQKKFGLFREWERNLAEARASSPPDAGASKKLITMWMTYWPWDLFWTFMRDFVVELWDNIYPYFAKIFESIGNRIVGEDIRRDFERKKA